VGDPIMVYSVKVNADDLAKARKFFDRSGLRPQDVVRGLIKTAADCETCLQLIETKAALGEVQSAFASILSDAKETWRLNGLFQDVMLETARLSNIPQDFITNVLAEAQRISKDATQT